MLCGPPGENGKPKGVCKLDCVRNLDHENSEACSVAGYSCCKNTGSYKQFLNDDAFDILTMGEFGSTSTTH